MATSRAREKKAEPTVRIAEGDPFYLGMSENKVRYGGRKWSTSIQNEFIREPNLSYPARFLYILLMSYASPDSPCPFPRFETLAYFMGSFRKDRESGELVRKDMDEDALRKYRQELIDKGYLEMERRRSFEKHKEGSWTSNIYTLLDGPPHPENPGLGKSGAGKNPGPENPHTKSTHIVKEVPNPGRATNNNKFASATRASSASRKAPSGLIGRAMRAVGSVGMVEDEDTTQVEEGSPEVRQEETSQEEHSPQVRQGELTSKQKTGAFIQLWKKWFDIVHKTPASIIPREMDLVEAYFDLNEKKTPLQLITLAVGAWMVKPLEKCVLDNGVDPAWHCRHKSKKIATFLKFMPEIEDTLQWTGEPEQVQRFMDFAVKRFKLQTA